MPKVTLKTKGSDVRGLSRRGGVHGYDMTVGKQKYEVHVEKADNIQIQKYRARSGQSPGNLHYMYVFDYSKPTDKMRIIPLDLKAGPSMKEQVQEKLNQVYGANVFTRLLRRATTQVY
jgi:hypothetical protein